jgi:hypothetical protein
LSNRELRNYAEHLVAPRTRWVAIAAGFVSGLAGSLAFGPLFAALPLILIFGAVLQRWSPHLGRWLMWLGAFYLTVDVAVFLGPGVLSPKQLLAPYYDRNLSVFFVLSVVSLALVGWCDVALIIDARKSKGASAPAEYKFRRTADWLVGMFALCLTASAVWSVVASIYPLRRYHRLDIFLFGAVSVVAVAAFDVAIVAHVVKMYCSRRSQGTA